MINKNFCALPWVSLDIDPQGNLRPCCKYKDNFGNDLDSYFNSDKLNALKKEFEDGNRPQGCIRCWNDEDAGLPSKRQLDRLYRYNELELNNLQVISIPFGNTCNLACRSCNSSASSKWVTEEEKLKNKFNIEIHSHKKFYKDDKFINFIKTKIDHVTDITFHGGESFLTGILQQQDFLDFLISKHPNTITLTYITNTTIFPSDDFWDKWKHFKKINILLSIDGIEEKFEYLRWPASWDVCYANIKKYQVYSSKFKNIQLSISHTVSIFNIIDLNEFFIWCLREKLPEPYLGVVEDPLHYNIKNLPLHIKEIVQKTLIPNKFAPIINFMNQNPSELTDTFTEWTTELDVLRKQNFHKIFPNLSKLLTY